MKIFSLTVDVFQAALNRIRMVFDEFPNVIVCISGGKDSTVLYHLALKVAKEKNRLPLTIMFIDQEAEWQATIDIIKSMMYSPNVVPRWYQMPIKIFNATSTIEHWLQCWDPEQEDLWVHKMDPISVKENVYKTDRFHQLFKEIIDYEYPDSPAAYLGGVRTEESPNRFMGLTQSLKYRDITWGRKLNSQLGHYTFYPIYDWAYTDIWKAIHDNKWPYNKIYDLQYMYGTTINKMRVSNLHHETAVGSLFCLQEMEPEVYAKLCNRLKGIDMAGKFGKNDYFVSKLPFMFESWTEYRDYLLENLIENPEWKKRFRKAFKSMDETLEGAPERNLRCIQISSILTNDWEFTKLKNALNSPNSLKYKRKNQKLKVAA